MRSTGFFEIQEGHCGWGSRGARSNAAVAFRFLGAYIIEIFSHISGSNVLTTIYVSNSTTGATLGKLTQAGESYEGPTFEVQLNFHNSSRKRNPPVVLFTGSAGWRGEYFLKVRLRNNPVQNGQVRTSPAVVQYWYNIEVGVPATDEDGKSLCDGTAAKAKAGEYFVQTNDWLFLEHEEVDDYLAKCQRPCDENEPPGACVPVCQSPGDTNCIKVFDECGPPGLDPSGPTNNVYGGNDNSCCGLAVDAGADAPAQETAWALIRARCAESASCSPASFVDCLSDVCLLDYVEGFDFSPGSQDLAPALDQFEELCERPVDGGGRTLYLHYSVLGELPDGAKVEVRRPGSNTVIDRCHGPASGDDTCSTEKICYSTDVQDRGLDILSTEIHVADGDQAASVRFRYKDSNNADDCHTGNKVQIIAKLCLDVIGSFCYHANIGSCEPTNSHRRRCDVVLDLPTVNVSDWFFHWETAGDFNNRLSNNDPHDDYLSESAYYNSSTGVVRCQRGSAGCNKFKSCGSLNTPVAITSPTYDVSFEYLDGYVPLQSCGNGATRIRAQLCTHPDGIGAPAGACIGGVSNPVTPSPTVLTCAQNEICAFPQPQQALPAPFDNSVCQQPTPQQLASHSAGTIFARCKYTAAIPTAFGL